ncbi:MAG: DUF11 domain-containing protein [Proteobacteria bacterium]|nr:DUF11 domain-containing protein [Pseudomonadota bacterium]
MARDRIPRRRSRAPGWIGGCLAWAFALLVLAAWPAQDARAAACNAATVQGTAPNDFRTYCWLDFTSYSDSAARSAGGQNFSYTLPDGSVMSFNLRITSFSGTNAQTALTGAAAPSWSGAAIGNAGFNGIPGKPVLYEVTSGTTVGLSITGVSVTPPAGGTTTYAFIAADGESTNTGEKLSFSTNGSPWSLLATINNGGYLPPLTGVGTNTVSENGNQTGSSSSYVFGTFNNPTTASASMTGSGLQGIMIGVRFASVSVAKVIAGQRVNAADQFTYSIKTTGGAVLASQTTTGTGTSGFPLASLPTIAASYPFVIGEAMAPGSVSTLANYSERLTCVNNTVGSTTTGLPNNVNTTAYTFPSLQFGDAIACTFTNSPNPSIFGTVYADANHDFNLDNGETGTGITGLYVKLSPRTGSTCSGPATVAAAVDPTTGNYMVPGVPSGNYCLILDNNNTLSDITPSVPAGWIGTEAATGIRQITFNNSTSLLNQNFGLYNGSTYSGVVFADTGIGTGGVPNNGSKDGTEAGIGNVVVNAVAGSTTVASASTDGAGNFTLYLPASVSGSVTVTPVAPTGDLATGGSAGTSGGSYTRPSVTFTAGGSSATGLAFGLVPANTFTPDGAQTTQPGTTVYYPHAFVAGSGGQVVFSSTAVAAPVLSGWTETIYRDVNCNGLIDGGDTLLSAPVPVTAGQTVCVIVREFVPANAPLGAQNAVTVSAAFTYVNANPALVATLARTDTTTVDLAGSVKISKLVTNLTQGGGAGTNNNASPGDSLRYDLVVTNPAAKPISQLVVNDATPAFTQFVSATCPGSLPANLSACAVTTQPGVGAQGPVVWTFTGTLAPGSQVTVSYRVTVSP